MNNLFSASSSTPHAFVPFQIHKEKPAFPNRHTSHLFVFWLRLFVMFLPKWWVLNCWRSRPKAPLIQRHAVVDVGAGCDGRANAKWAASGSLSCLLSHKHTHKRKYTPSWKCSCCIGSEHWLKCAFLSIISVCQWDPTCATGCGWNSMLFSVFLWAMWG